MTTQFFAPNITNATLFQYQCVNPPDDSCDFGPCPNPDVTGIGQRISIYITSIVFTIAVIHVPAHIKLATYTYLATLNSLVIAGVTSVAQRQLTQTDATFIFVATASPANIMISFLAIRALVGAMPKRFLFAFPHRWEQILLFVLSCLSWILWLIILALVFFIPSSTSRFSQPACSRKYGKANILLLVYVGVWFVLSGWTGFTLWWMSPNWHLRREENMKDSRSNIIRWTRTGFLQEFGMFGKTKYGTVAFIFIFQLGVSPRIQGSDFTYLTYITRRSAATSFDYIFFTIDDALTGLLLSIFIWAWFVEMPSWKSAGWCALVTFIHCLATVIYIFLPTWIGGKVFRGFVMQYYYVAFVILQIRRRKLIQRHPKSIQWLAIIDITWPCLAVLVNTIMPIFPSQAVWFHAWITLYEWPSPFRVKQVDILWERVIDPLPIFKFTFFILIPSIKWIQATMISLPPDQDISNATVFIQNPALATQMSYGQVLSLITSIVSLGSLVHETWRQRLEILNSLWPRDEPSSPEKPTADYELPTLPQTNADSDEPTVRRASTF